MPARTVRSSNSTILMWIGAIIMLFGAFTGLYGLAPLTRGSIVAGLIFVLIGALIALVGVAVAMVGWRTSARVDGQGVSWSSGLGSRTSVPWQQIARVVVPGAADPGSAVSLQLRDGRIVPVTPLRKMQSPDESTGLSPWYLRAGSTLQEAHQQWLSQPHRH